MIFSDEEVAILREALDYSIRIKKANPTKPSILNVEHLTKKALAIIDAKTVGASGPVTIETSP